MKKILMGIFMVILLAFSMLGSVNFVKEVNADSDNIHVGNIVYSPIIAIRAVDYTMDVTFRVANIDVDNVELEFLTVEVTNPRLGGDILEDYLNAGNPTPEYIENLTTAEDPTSVTFRVSILEDSTIGNYIGTIKVTQVDAEGNVVADNFKEISYTINVEDSNPSITFTGLNDEDEELVFTGEEDSQSVEEFTITNNGNIVLNDLQIVFPDVNGEFEDSDGNKITFSYRLGTEGNYDSVDLVTKTIDLTELAVGASLVVSIRANIPDDIELDIYSEDILVKSNSFEELNTGLVDNNFDINVRVEPEVCKDGRVSDEKSVGGPNQGNLRIKIDNPDDGDDYKIGEEIEIEVEVENRENKDMDFVVEAILYNLDKNEEIVTVESDSMEVEEDSKEDFDLILKIPIDDEDLDESDTIMLYIKVYEDGDQDQFCNYDSVEIEIERENDQVIVNTFTINPIVASQGDMISFRVGVENVGTDKQNDVYIQIKNIELGLDLTSLVFDLKKYDKNGNDQVKTFTFNLPKNAEAKEYNIEAIVHFDKERETESAFGKLIVEGELTVTTEGDTTETNTGVTTETTTGAGTYSLTGNSILESLGSTKTLFIIGDIVLVILAVLFLILIFRKR